MQIYVKCKAQQGIIYNYLDEALFYFILRRNMNSYGKDLEDITFSTGCTGIRRKQGLELAKQFS